MNKSGLRIVQDFVSADEERRLLEEIDNQEWSGRGIEPNPELQRRTQQYGCIFSYRERKIIDKKGNSIPPFCQELIKRMAVYISDKDIPDSVIINEYEAGQGIMPHIDSPKIFGKVIFSLSLLSECLMLFQKDKHTVQSSDFTVRLPRRSLLMLEDDIRYNWNHSISKDTVEFYNGEQIVRSRRVSLTFRKINP